MINSGNLAKGTTLMINAQGFESSARGIKDGVTYFGCKKKGPAIINKKRPAINDFIIPTKDKETAQRHRYC